MKLTVLITGAQGQLGQALLATPIPAYMRLVGLSREQLDITQSSHILKAIFQYKPHIIINCAAFTNVNLAELEPERAAEVNTQGVKNLVRVCAAKNIKFIQLSTDYVFSGEQAQPYNEQATCAPLNVYGRTKLEAEAAALTLGRRALVLRSSWLISDYGHNFKRTMLAKMQAGEALSVIDDQVGTPTLAVDLAQWIVYLLPPFWRGEIAGLYHAGGAQCLSWYELAVAIQAEALSQGVLAQAVSIKAISSAEYQQQVAAPVAQRPVNSSLDSRALQALMATIVA